MVAASGKQQWTPRDSTTQVGLHSPLTTHGSTWLRDEEAARAAAYKEMRNE